MWRSEKNWCTLHFLHSANECFSCFINNSLHGGQSVLTVNWKRLWDVSYYEVSLLRIVSCMILSLGSDQQANSFTEIIWNVLIVRGNEAWLLSGVVYYVVVISDYAGASTSPFTEIEINQPRRLAIDSGISIESSISPQCVGDLLSIVPLKKPSDETGLHAQPVLSQNNTESWLLSDSYNPPGPSTGAVPKTKKTVPIKRRVTFSDNIANAKPSTSSSQVRASSTKKTQTKIEENPTPRMDIATMIATEPGGFYFKYPHPKAVYEVVPLETLTYDSEGNCFNERLEPRPHEIGREDEECELVKISDVHRTESSSILYRFNPKLQILSGNKNAPAKMKCKIVPNDYLDYPRNSKSAESLVMPGCSQLPVKSSAANASAGNAGCIKPVSSTNNAVSLSHPDPSDPPKSSSSAIKRSTVWFARGRGKRSVDQFNKAASRKPGNLSTQCAPTSVVQSQMTVDPPPRRERKIQPDQSLDYAINWKPAESWTVPRCSSLPVNPSTANSPATSEHKIGPDEFSDYAVWKPPESSGVPGRSLLPEQPSNKNEQKRTKEPSVSVGCGRGTRFSDESNKHFDDKATLSLPPCHVTVRISTLTPMPKGKPVHQVVRGDFGKHEKMSPSWFPYIPSSAWSVQPVKLPASRHGEMQRTEPSAKELFRLEHLPPLYNDDWRQLLNHPDILEYFNFSPERPLPRPQFRDRCYNCLGRGHDRTDCPEELAPFRYCFNCGERGYTIPTCPHCGIWWRLSGGGKNAPTRDYNFRMKKLILKWMKKFSHKTQ